MDALGIYTYHMLYIVPTPIYSQMHISFHRLSVGTMANITQSLGSASVLSKS